MNNSLLLNLAQHRIILTVQNYTLKTFIKSMFYFIIHY